MRRHIRAAAVIAAAVLASSQLRAQEQREETKQPAAGEQLPRPQRHETASAPVYKPPLRGAPGGRIGGGTRGSDALSLAVLAPDHTGLTVEGQPSLYWAISTKSPAPVEVTIVDPRVSEPLLELQIKNPVEAGVHAVRLAEHKVQLEPGVAYRWYVAVVRDASRRSRDVLAGGSIERVAASESLRTRLATISIGDKPAAYAEAGIWYDALGAISQLIEQSPADATLRSHRAAMLAQVGLKDLGSAATAVAPGASAQR